MVAPACLPAIRRPLQPGRKVNLAGRTTGARGAVGVGAPNAFSQPPKKSTPPKEGYLPHPPPERLQKEAYSRRLRVIPVTFMHPPARHSSRVGQRFQLALGAAAALAAISLSPGSAQAYVVTVGGVQYDVTSFTGTYNDNTSKFATAANGGVMPWWGNSSLANQFANAVGNGLGTLNGEEGPLFGYVQEGPGNGFISHVSFNSGNLNFGYKAINTSATWAQVTPSAAAAPGPLPLLGAAAAFGFSRQLRKRIKLAPAALGSALPLA